MILDKNKIYYLRDLNNEQLGIIFENNKFVYKSYNDYTGQIGYSAYSEGWEELVWGCSKIAINAKTLFKK